MHFKRKAKLSAFGCSIVLASLTAGCAGTMNPKPVDYDKLPGSGDRMAEGPGLAGSQRGSNYDGGYTVYSDDPSKQALIHRNGSQPSAGAPQQMAAQDEAAAPAEEASQPTTTQQQNYREFQQYQQFKRFQQMPENSAEHQRFEDWKEWKEYEQWRRNGQNGAH